MKVSSLTIALLLCCVISSSFSSEPAERPFTTPAVTWNPTGALININRLSTTFSNDGWGDRDRATGEPAFVFPKGTKRTMIFQSGLLWGAKIGDSIHVGGSTYRSGLQPGKILSPGVAEDPNLSKTRIYRVRPDYVSADFSLESRETGLLPFFIRDQYARDWNEWPAADGAPFDDRNGNGTYEPAIDIPGQKGADQTIWFVANDLDTGRTRGLYGRRPLGIEMQVTIWAYNREGALGNTLFKYYRLINKSTNRFDSLFVSQWVDPDLGYYGDDYLGCDVPLNMQYCYNAFPFDPMYGSVTPPAVGFVFLAQPMYAAVAKWTGSWFIDPPYTYDGGRQWYNWMRGLLPMTGEPFIHPWVASEPTRYWLDGDPITRSGRVDGYDHPGDRRMHATVGPFTLSPGETLDVPIAVVAGFGSNNITGVTTLRRLARAALRNFPGTLMSTPPVAQVRVSYPNATEASVLVIADVRGGQVQRVSARLHRQDRTMVVSNSLFDDGLHGDGAAGDGIWGNTLTLPRAQSAVYLDLSVLDSTMREVVWERVADNIPVSGPVRVVRPRVLSDNINSDGLVNPDENIRYGFTIVSEAAFPHGGIAVHPSLDVEFKMLRHGIISPGGSDSLHYNPNDTLSYFSFTAPSGGTKLIPLTLADTSDNLWQDTAHFAVIPYDATIVRSRVRHVAGQSEWAFNVIVAHPPAVKNHTYEITIVDSLDTLRTKALTLRDSSTNTVLLSHHSLPDELGHIMPVIDGFKLTRGERFGKLGVRDDSTRWISSASSWLIGSRRFRDEHAAFNGGVTTGSRLSAALTAVRSNFDPAYSFPIEVRFSRVATQKAYRLFRQSGTYVIRSSNPFTTVPFTVWDVQDRTRPRQLTVAWNDFDDSGVWDPPWGGDGGEIVFLYNKTYDPTGTTQFSMPPNAIPNECTVGANADIVYGLSLMVPSGHELNESPGTLYIRPWLALTRNDRFLFNPTEVLDTLYLGLPTAYKLYQNYPNPFNPATTIRYELPGPSRVTLTIFNILGQKVKTLISGMEDAGVHHVQWDGRNDQGLGVATGVYFYRLEASAVSGASSFTQVKKMLVLR